MTALETAVIQRMLADPQVSPRRRVLDPSNPFVVEERSVSEVGFITSFARNDAAKLFTDDTSMRWGQIVGRLNKETDVDFVVYVDDGFVNAVEGVTFGGEAWPSSVDDFELTEIART
jgi:hypothetical protein